MTDRTQQFATAPLGRLILTYSAPAIAGLLVYGLNRVVGNIYVGLVLGTEALAGFTVANTVVTIVLAFVVLVGAGTAVALSIQLGKKNLTAARGLLGTSMVLSVVLAVPLGVLGWVFRDPLLVAFGARGEALTYGRDFLSTFLVGVLFQFLTNTFNSSLRAVGRPMAALSTNVLSFLINTALTAVFLVVLPWGIAGVGLANVVTQGLMMVWTGSFFVSRRALVRLGWSSLRWDAAGARSIVKNGLAPFSLQILMAALGVLTNLVVAAYAGNEGMAIVGVVFSLYFLLVMPLQGMGTGVQPIFGYNFGAGKMERVYAAVKKALLYTTVICCLEFVVVLLFRSTLVSLFVHDQPRILDTGSRCLLAAMTLFPLAGISTVFISFFQSVGHARQAVGLTVFRSLFSVAPLVVLPLFLGLPGVFWSYPVTEAVMTGTSLTVFLLSVKPAASSGEL